ncbi:MAG TPA: hypothetical protein VF785_03330 [Gemmatimonadaceae bacterium]|nr:hypothetical protein [Acidimicrobiia bacterium]
MRSAKLLLLIPFVACASSGGGSAPAPASQTVRVVGPQGGASLTMATPDAPNVHTLSFTADQVWRALPAAFDSLGIPIGTLDPVKRSMGNAGFKIRGRLKGVPLSRYIDCGTSTQIGPNADNYDVSITILADVRPAEPGTTTVTTTFNAAGRPANFAQEYSDCRSKGVLEGRLVDIVRGRLEHASR